MSNELMIFLITGFLGVSILLYCLFAGADFGGGILEIFAGKKMREEQEELITHAMGPVWEANHVWLILAVVILMNGFPKAYSELSVRFHIPLSFILIGIVFRGCAFTFRHYDAVRDRSQHYYSWIFKISSALTTWALGVVAGGIFLNQPILNKTSYSEIYVSPWLNVFSCAVGIFAFALFGFLASVYLIGEAHDEKLKEIFTSRARAMNGVAIGTGILVFVSAELQGLELIRLFLKNEFSLFCMVIATLILFPLWRSLYKGRIMASRVFAATQISLVLLGWFGLQSPRLVGNWTIYDAAAPSATLKYLLYALTGGSFLIFPALFFLLRIFKIPDLKGGDFSR